MKKWVLDMWFGRFVACMASHWLYVISARRRNEKIHDGSPTAHICSWICVMLTVNDADLTSRQQSRDITEHATPKNTCDVGESIETGCGAFRCVENSPPLGRHPQCTERTRGMSTRRFCMLRWLPF